MGLRLDADAFFALEDDGHKYELLHGVVVVSPSPRVSHQRAASRLFSAMASFAAAQSAGEVFYETDVRLAANIVYRPDIMFYASGRSETVQDQFRVAPDIAIEFLSGSSRNMDMRTKRDEPIASSCLGVESELGELVEGECGLDPEADACEAADVRGRATDTPA